MISLPRMHRHVSFRLGSAWESVQQDPRTWLRRSLGLTLSLLKGRTVRTDVAACGAVRVVAAVMPWLVPEGDGVAGLQALTAIASAMTAPARHGHALLGRLH
jgi:hypothetical protein